MFLVTLKRWINQNSVMICYFPSKITHLADKKPHQHFQQQSKMASANKTGTWKNPWRFRFHIAHTLYTWIQNSWKFIRAIQGATFFNAICHKLQCISHHQALQQRKQWFNGHIWARLWCILMQIDALSPQCAFHLLRPKQMAWEHKSWLLCWQLVRLWN